MNMVGEEHERFTGRVDVCLAGKALPEGEPVEGDPVRMDCAGLP